MRNIKLMIAYDGSNFKGWQIQKKGERTVQGEIQNRLTKLCKHPVKLIGSGRTDAGVHAYEQVAHFHTGTPIPNDRLFKALNNDLPQDIAIRQVQTAPIDFHARYSITSKTYLYKIHIHPQPTPFLSRYTTHISAPLNITKMQQVARLFIGTHNFGSFQSTTQENRDKCAIRNLTHLTIHHRNELITIKITASGFLYKMARNIISTLIQIGKGDTSSEYIQKLLQNPSRLHSPKPAPPNGLYLWRCRYA